MTVGASPAAGDWGCDIGPGGNLEDDASSVVNRDGDMGGGQLEAKVSSVQRHGTSRPGICSDEEVFGVAN